MSDRPDLSKRRTIVPAPDEGIDPIDLHKVPSPEPTPTATAAPAKAKSPTNVQTASPTSPKPRTPNKAELPPRDLNLQVTSEVMETIDFAKFKTKLTKREIVQRAVLEYWSEYRPKDT